MNYIDYINEVVKPRTTNTSKLSKNLAHNFKTKAPEVDDDPEIIIRPFITKRDVIIAYNFSSPIGGEHISIDIGFDFRGMCIDVGPLRDWDYFFWRR